MPYLVRWDSEGTPITLRCDNVSNSVLFSEHVKLVNVLGIQDGDHPDLKIHTVNILRSEIMYVAEAIAEKVAPEPESKPEKAEPEPIVDQKPEPEPKKKTIKRRAPRKIK